MACLFNLASVHEVCCATLLGYVGFNFQHFQSYHVGSQLNDKDSFAVFLLWSYSFSLEANGADGSQLSMMENILWHHVDPRSNWILVLSHASDSERSITLAFYLTTRRGARMNVWLLGQTGITLSFETFWKKGNCSFQDIYLHKYFFLFELNSLRQVRRSGALFMYM